MDYLSRDDLKKLHAMLAGYYDAVIRKSVTPSGIPVHLHIANDIVSQAVEPLLQEHAALREIAEAVAERHEGSFGIVRDAVLCYNDNAGYTECPWCAGSDDDAGLSSEFHHMPDCPVTKARALLGIDGEART